MRAVLLCHDKFGPLWAKTATCILRYPRTYKTMAVIDRSKVGKDASEFVGNVGRGVPILGSVQDALKFKPQVLIIGIAPAGGGLPEFWKTDLKTAIENGMEIHSGLHYFISEDPELAPLAKARGVRIWDVRKPQRPPRIATSEGRRINGLVVHTMGTDCGSGKMTTSVELVEEAKRRGLKVGFAATGQTGIMIGCDSGAPIDRIISDFVAGAAEELVLECDQKGFDLISVEGQGSLDHPAYSGVTLGLMHGCFPDQIILCHEGGRTHHGGFDRPPNDFPLLSLKQHIELIETLLAPLSGGKVVAVSVATFRLDEAAAHKAVRQAEQETGLPATDPVRFGAGKLVDAILKAAQRSPKPGAQRLCALKPAVSH